MSRYVHHLWIIGLHSALCRRLYNTFGVLVPVRALCVRTATVEEKKRVSPFPFFRLSFVPIFGIFVVEIESMARHINIQYQRLQ